MQPIAELLDLPKEYGSPKEPLGWATVREELERARCYWIVTVREDGRPHAVPVDGVWIDDAWYYGGSPKAVHVRSVLANSEMVMHLEDGTKVVIVEGQVRRQTPSKTFAERLATLSNEKYGYGMAASDYERGVLVLRPRRVLAWMAFPKDATRFVFDER